MHESSVIELVIPYKDEPLLRTITTWLKRRFNESIVSEESNWIVVGPSPFQAFRKNVLFAHAVFDWRQTQNHV